LNLPINQIICGDNVETLAGFPDDCIDLTVTSPPYDNLRTYGGHSWDFEGVAQQLWRVTKPGGVVVWVVADATVNGSETGTSFRQALQFMEIGFRLHDTMIYMSNKPPLTHNRYEQSWEYMFVLAKDAPRTFNALKRRTETAGGLPGRFMQNATDGKYSEAHKQQRTGHETYRPNAWYYFAGKDSSNGDHPAPFPEALARDHILSWSNEGDTVLDPFSGSGTTAKMAKHNGRQYIGIEVNPEYCEIAEERLRQGVLF
jgi:site-specific DNA-methyltransferase (adenine-specific)